MPIIYDMPEAEYHAAREHYLTSHALATFRKSPAIYQAARLGQIVNEESPAMLFGRAAHCAILEGPDKYAERYVVGGPINEKTGREYGSDTKAWRDYAASVGKPVVGVEDHTIINLMRASVFAHDRALELLRTGRPEVVVRGALYGVHVQSRIDWLNESRGHIVDLKTCADLDEFERDARRFQYGHQMAFYMSVVAGNLPPIDLDCYLIAVEKRIPYRCGVWVVAPEGIERWQQENSEAILRFNGCNTYNNWPTGYESVRALHAD